MSDRLTLHQAVSRNVDTSIFAIARYGHLAPELAVRKRVHSQSVSVRAKTDSCCNFADS